jgi:HSP20 family protein
MNILSRRVCPSPVSDLGRIFDEFFAEPLLLKQSQALPPMHSPLAMDISEDDAQYIVRANLPGFTKEQVEVEAHDGVLTIRAGRSEEHVEEEPAAKEGEVANGKSPPKTVERLLRRERHTGMVTRSITLPEPFEQGRTTAELKDGVLTVVLPKTVNATPKRISIN